MELRRFIAARIADPVIWTVIKRYPVFRLESEWRRLQWSSRAEFEARQGRSLGSLLRHALERVPFYTRAVAGLSPEKAEAKPEESLSMFPVLEKSDLATHTDSLVCEMGRGSYWNRTGGSTGEPVRFLQDSEYQAGALATTSLFFEWAGVQPGARHIKLWGAPRDLGHGRAALRRRAADWFLNRMTLDAFDMSDETMQRYIETISRERPACLEGYADALFELAVRIEERGLSMGAPGVIVSSAGTLHSHMRKKVERAFGAEVFDRYGTREIGNVAAECDRHDGLHVFGETTVMEIVGEDGRPVEEGDEGEILITQLRNYTMPLIRYRIGDRAVRGRSRCGCGRVYPMLERVSGRSESRVLRRDGGVVLSEFFIHVIGVEHNDGSIAKFQVVQESLDHLHVLIVPSAGAGERALASAGAIRARIQQMMGACRIDFVLVERIEPTPTGKHLYVVNRMEERE